MKLGVTIEKGPAHWQIIQQEEGYGTIALSGSFASGDKRWPFQIWVKIVREASGEPILPWTPAMSNQNGTWSFVFDKIPAGGLYRIETCLKEDNTLYFDDCLRGDIRHHIGVGDLFVIAGQSNASGTARDFVMEEPQLGVHVLRASGKWDLATHPFNDSTDSVHEVNRENYVAGHSPFLSFGKYMKSELGYPIGLIPAALGGSPLSRWLPSQNGDLFANMMEILSTANHKIKGMLWYQGCTDADNKVLYHDYELRFADFVACVRENLGENLPIFTVQLNRRTDVVSAECDLGWKIVREAQRQAAKKIKGVYMVPALDGTLSDVIHNSASFNVVIGERLAKKALATIYAKLFLCDAPDFAGATLCRNIVTVRFSNVTDRLDAFEMRIEDLLLEVSDEHGSIPILQYTLFQDALELQLSRKPKGVCSVSNALGANPRGLSIIDFGTHLPIVAFFNELVQMVED